MGGTVVIDLSSHKTADVSHVAHEHGSTFVSNSPHPGEVPVSRVRTSTRDDHLRPEVQSLLLKLVVIDEASLIVHLVGQALEENRSGGNLLASRGVVAMCEMTTRRQIQAHDAVMRLQQSSVNCEVSRRSRVRLHIDTPFRRVKMESLESSLLTQILNLVNELVPSIVASARKTFRVLVGESTTQSFDDSLRGEILGRDQLNASTLPHFLPLYEIENLLICDIKRRVSPGLHRGFDCFRHNTCEDFPRAPLCKQASEEEDDDDPRVSLEAREDKRSAERRHTGVSRTSHNEVLGFGIWRALFLPPSNKRVINWQFLLGRGTKVFFSSQLCEGR